MTAILEDILTTVKTQIESLELSDMVDDSIIIQKVPSRVQIFLQF